MKGKMLLLLNPVSGKGKGKAQLYKIVNIFSENGFEVNVVPTRSREHIITYVRENAGRFDIAVAVGGDGTLNNVINGIMASGARIPIGYIPLGSTNDFAASVQIPRNIQRACELICKNDPKETDVGKFGDQYFTYIACTGLFADASYTTPQQMKNALGYSAYLLHGMESLLEDHNMKCIIETDTERIEEEIVFLSVSNSLRAGGVFRLPRENVAFDDGRFELLMFRAPKNLAEGTKIANSLVSGIPSNETMLCRPITKARFILDAEHGWSLDGENGGKHADIEFEVLEKALLFVR